MTSDLDRYEAAKKALDGLIAETAQTSVRAAHDIGVEFDVDDPRVARWLMPPFAMEGCVMRHDPASAAVVVMLKALKRDCR